MQQQQEEEKKTEQSQESNPYAQISDFFCSLTTVKYILDSANIKEDVMKQIEAEKEAEREREESRQEGGTHTVQTQTIGIQTDDLGMD